MPAERDDASETARKWPPGYQWGDDPRTDWKLLNTGDEATRTQRRLEFLRTGAPYPSPPQPQWINELHDEVRTWPFPAALPAAGPEIGTNRRFQFDGLDIQKETPVTEPTAAPLTRDDVPAVLDAALSRFEELRTPLFDPSTAFSIDACPAGRDHPGKLEIMFSPQPAHREELLGRLRKGLAAAGYDAWPQDIPELVGSGTLSILVSRSPDAERMRAAALSETIDRLTHDAGLAAHGFLSQHAPDLALCTAAARDGLLVRFVVAYLVSTGMVTAAPAQHPGWRALDLDEPYASELAAALLEAVEQRAKVRHLPTQVVLSPAGVPGVSARDAFLNEQWLQSELEPTKLDDPRLTLARTEAGLFAGFNVATEGGVAEVRLRGEGEANFFDPSTWAMWCIRSGPNGLAGTLYQTAGEAVRAALRGWVWPTEEWGRESLDAEPLSDRWSEPPTLRKEQR